PEIAVLPLLGISSLLVPNQAHRQGLVAQYTEPANYGRVVPELSVAMDFDEFAAKVLYVIEKVRTLWVTCKLYLLVRCQVVHILKSLSEANCITSTDAFNSFHELP